MYRRPVSSWPVGRLPVLLPLLLLAASGAGRAQQCQPLVLCPALLRDPANHLTNSQAACYLPDGSQGVLCPTETNGDQALAQCMNGGTSNNVEPQTNQPGSSGAGGASYGSSGYDSNGYRKFSKRDYGTQPTKPTISPRLGQEPLPRRLTRPEDVLLQKLSPKLRLELLRRADKRLATGEQIAQVLTAQGSNVALSNTGEELQLLFSRPVLQSTVLLGRQGEKNAVVLQETGRVGGVFSGSALQPELARHQHFQLPQPPAALLQAGRETLPGCTPAETPSCSDKDNRYRTHDGTCNNLQRPRQGSAHSVYNRFFPSDYDDGLHAPRSRGINGKQLPSPRLVSSVVGEGNSLDSLDLFRTIGLTLFGQFIDHDLTSTPEFSLENTSSDEEGDGGGFNCCNRDHSFPATSMHPLACIPIRVPVDDPVFGPQGVTCLNQVRSLLGSVGDCLPRPAAQQNQITHYLDGSNIYGSDDDDSRQLRLHIGGRIRMTRSGNLLPRDENRCSAHPHDCFMSGDHRTSENIGLAYEHLVWTREHNRVAAALAELHPYYDDEQLYQEARRIVVGEFQHVVYNEWLPAILGYCYTLAADLAPGSSKGYLPDVSAVIANEFSTAAFRFGHSMVHDVFELESQTIALERTFFNSSFLMEFGLVRELARSLTTQRPGWVDRAFTSALRERLFIMPGMPGLDLIALNINRGREHGLQPYITAVENCFGRNISSWEDLEDLLEPETIDSLSSVYDRVEDVDLFIGIVSERRALYSAVGRTLQCLIGQQFMDLRDGDRFFYEHSNLPNSFTTAQLAELKRVSLARIYCDNVPELGHIQPLAFFQPPFFANARQSCDSLAIPRPDLSVF